MLVVTQSHAGETGKNNEDSFSATAHRLESDGTPSLLAIVADGIGGHQAGEVASRITVETIHEALSAASGRQPIQQLRSAVVAAGRAVARAAEESESRQGMGSTVAVAWVIGSHLYTASVGDSRMYLLRQDRLRQLTIDHTWVQEALDHRIIVPEEAKGHPNAHILRRHLGGGLDVEPDLRMQWNPGDDDVRAISRQGMRLNVGDQILLCTDGLTDLVDSGEIADALHRGPPREAVESLVVLARARGGHDNITLILLEVPPGSPVRARVLPRWSILLGAVVALLALIVLGLGIAWWTGWWPWR
ncbi:MAG TPA: protein phosphatase 2C domain-containing protein [Anaerolineales bacterium]|nr:protein phosphatase 2C domain-containing protein [Anaerolineales bacterium]